MSWYHHEELRKQAESGKTQPEFDLDQDLLNEEDEVYEEVPLDDSAVDNLTDEEQALITRVNEVKSIVDTDITRDYPTVSGDV